MNVKRQFARSRLSRRWRDAVVLACAIGAVSLGGVARAADPTPDPAEPYFRGPPVSVGLDPGVAHDRRPAQQIASRQPGKRIG